jgi:hypothetical protein
MQRRFRVERSSEGGKCQEGTCPYCYENRKQRANHKGHRYFVSTHIRVATYGEMQMKRPSQVSGSKKGAFVCPDAAFLSNYPNLAAGLCDPWWDDGKPRDCWTIKISMRDDGVMFAVNDPGLKMVAFTTAEGLTEGFMAIEAALAGQGLSWRRSKW